MCYYIFQYKKLIFANAKVLNILSDIHNRLQTFLRFIRILDIHNEIKLKVLYFYYTLRNRRKNLYIFYAPYNCKKRKIKFFSL